MRKIKYKRLSVQNFLSVGNDTLVIDFQNGLNLITGIDIDNPERRNGAGKSVIIESFYYALFGTTIREIKKEFVVNNVTKGKGCIALWFDVQTDTGTSSYKVIRQLKPSTVELWKLGDQDEDISKDSIANTNKYICDLIGSNPTICKSCDILSLSDNTPFMAKKPEEKRKFIEDIFALEIFGKMLKDLKDQIKENKSELSTSVTTVTEITNSLDTLRKLSIIQKEQEDGRKAEMESKIKKLEAELEALVIIPVDEILKENEKLHDGWVSIDGKLAKLMFSLSEETASLKSKQKELLKTSGVSGATCDKCLQDIPHTHIEHIEKIKEDLGSDISDIEKNIGKINLEISDWLSKKSRIQTKIGVNTEIIKKSKKVDDDRLNAQLAIELLINISLELDNSKPYESYNDKIKEVEVRLETESKKLEVLQQTQGDLEMCKFILGEEGIKSFIIKRLLDMLNASIQKYIISLGMTMRCKFDEYFDEQITTDTGKATTYWNFSGGERRTVDIACSWAFKDIKRKISGVSSNVEFFDEIFDAAFDPVGFDKLIDVLKERIDKHSLSCYAISHRQETLKHIDGETVNLEKENKITRRIVD